MVILRKRRRLITVASVAAVRLSVSMLKRILGKIDVIVVSTIRTVRAPLKN